MTWQDELRRLDEELAAGRLAPEEYRHLRDALLSSQSDQPTTRRPADQEPDLDATRGPAQPPSPPEPTPFPPPFRWDNGGLEPTQRTQMSPDSNDTERTQV